MLPFGGVDLQMSRKPMDVHLPGVTKGVVFDPQVSG